MPLKELVITVSQTQLGMPECKFAVRHNMIQY